MSPRTSLIRRTRRPAIAALALAAASTLGLTAPAPAVTASVAEAAPTVFKGKVTANGGLTQRVAPSAYVAAAGTPLRKGAIISIECQLNGTSVDGNARWYKIYGKDRWVAARYVSNVGKAPYACTAGDWSYRVTTTTVVRQGPSTKDRRISSLVRGTEFNTRWITARGQSVDGNPNWVAVETPSGNRGWISATNLRLVA